MQPRWKKYLKLPWAAATEAKFAETVSSLEALAEVAWRLQQGPHPSTRCAAAGPRRGAPVEGPGLQGRAVRRPAPVSARPCMSCRAGVPGPRRGDPAGPLH